MSEWTKKFNPFNSDKLFSHVYRWRERPLAAPATITVDPSNSCNLDCSWCNSQSVRQSDSSLLDTEIMRELPKFLGNWSKSKKYPGVESVCIAGGGEPLTHPYVQEFVEGLDLYDIKAGVITNGVLLDRVDLSSAEWIGVSVDAGTKETFEKLKGKDLFGRVIRNLEGVVNKGNLGQPGQGHGVSYKYLLHPENVGEVYEAARIAKQSGCRNLHIRPFGNPWDRDLKTPFSYSDIQEFREQLERARELEDDTFGVFGITHKFDGDLRKSNDFERCNAVLMTAAIQPAKKGFNYGHCCDRRGDPNLTIHMDSLKEIRDYWGSDEHLAKADIDPKSCPRCTYQPHNKIYEKAIKEDNTTYEFI